MPTKLKRYTFVCPAKLEELIERDANLNERSVSNQIVWNLKQFYEGQERAASLFTQSPSDDRREPPVFRTPEKPSDRTSEGPRGSRNQEKS